MDIVNAILGVVTIVGTLFGIISYADSKKSKKRGTARISRCPGGTRRIIVTAAENFTLSAKGLHNPAKYI